MQLHHAIFFPVHLALSNNSSISLHQLHIKDGRENDVEFEAITSRKLSMFGSLPTKYIKGNAHVYKIFQKFEMNWYPIWLSIVGNYSIFYAHPGLYEPCKFLRFDLVITTYLIAGVLELQEVAYFENYQAAMRFLTCLPRGGGNLTFSQLVTIFDKSIWLTLFQSITLLSLLFSIMEPDDKHNVNAVMRKAFNHLFSTLKVLLEQEYPLPSKVIGITKLQLLIGAFLLMGLVISNAYKNTDVLVLISP